jgi:hypothetical protein
LKNKENVLMADTPQQDTNYCLIDKLRSLNGTIEDFSAGWNGRVENYNTPVNIVFLCFTGVIDYDAVDTCDFRLSSKLILQSV